MEEILDVESQKQQNSSLFVKANYPVTLKFQDVVYKIDIQNIKGFFKKQLKSEEKVILNGITGSVLPGELLAMLGPSGSGKTTLLSTLGGRLSGNVSGTITFNDKLLSNSMKRNTGFVTQDDVLYPHLTVTETLVYTALLRLPRSITREEKVQHAEGVITKLGLTNCKNSIIGDAFVRGVSGGERKRVSIGQELLINPSVLFLDEPTSGLDSTTAQRIVSTLWDLANGGRTVVMTIHQPSSRLFYMFHKVLLLSEGNTMYYGKGEEAMTYFSSIGYAPSITMNPSDFLLDLANGIVSGNLEEHESTIKQSLISTFMRIKAESLRAEIMQQASDYVQNTPEAREIAKWRTNWWQQFTILLSRGLKERKHESFAGFRIVEALVISFVTGLLWWRSDMAHIQDQTGLLFSYTAFWGFFPLYQAIFTFPQERKMLEKERSSGMYRLSSYFMSRVIGDLPMELVLPTAFIIITYCMAGLRATLKNFILTWLSLLYIVLVSQGLGLAIGALVMDQQAATTLGSVVMLSFLLAGGFYVQHVPGFISWIKYISMIQYTYKLLLASQYTPSDTYPCGENMCFVKDFPIVKTIGLDGQMIAVVALGIMLISYRLIAYLALMRIGVTK